MSKPMLRLTYDADGAGRQCGKAIIANDEQALHNISAKIDLGHEIVNQWISQRGGKRISGGGDEGSFRIGLEAAKKVEELRKKYFNATGLTISVGIGKDLSEAGRSLLYAKATGKDKIVWYGPKIEKGIEKMRKKVKAKTANQEEMKLADAYLEKSEYMKCDLHKKESHRKHLHKHEEGFHDSPEAEESKCPYCADDEDNRTDNCSYCQDLDAQENADGTAGMHENCPACKVYDSEQQTTGGIDTDNCPYCQETSNESGGVDGCPYCESETVGEAQAGTPEGQDVDHICNCPNCPKHDSTALEVQDMAAERPDDCPQCQEMYQDAVEEEPGQTAQEDPNMQGHETAEEVLDLLDQKPGQGDQTPETEAKKIDNTELPQGDEMEDGASITENFGDKQKANVSDPEKDMQNSDHECNCPDCPGSQQEESPIDRMASPDYQGTQGDVDQMAQEQSPEMGQDPMQSGQDPMADDGQDEPDMAGVLQGGLDEHAQEQKRAQVIDQVSQTLQGFKANKAFLEEAKDQSPGLYQSTIQMLKAMIELCKLLGLEPKMSSDAPQDPGAVAEATQSDAPDGPKQAAPGGAAQDPKAQAGAAQ
jgi:hypothetical protein